MSALEGIKAIMSSWFEQCANESAKRLGRIDFGKMLRSKLILAISKDSPKTRLLCAVIELIQNASLLHDDVIDESSMRRGKPSLNAVFGAKNAIMMGDLLYAKAFYELSSLGKDISQIVSEAVVALSNGEIADVAYTGQIIYDENIYLNIIRDKTASLLCASSKAAAKLAGLDEHRFGMYGHNLGMAFQIIDDVLDITQDSAKLGKESLSDFKEGKCTLPYIYLFQSLEHDKKQELAALFAKELDVNMQQWVLKQLHISNSIQKSIQKAREYGKDALDCIANIKNTELEEIILQMIEREF